MKHEVFVLSPAGAHVLGARPAHLLPQLHEALDAIHAQPRERAQLMPLMPRGELPPAQCLDTLLLLGLVERRWLPLRRSEPGPRNLSTRHFDESQCAALRTFLTEVMHAYLPSRVVQHELQSLDRLHDMHSLARRLTPIQALIAQYADPDTARQFSQAARGYLAAPPETQAATMAA